MKHSKRIDKMNDEAANGGYWSDWADDVAIGLFDYAETCEMIKRKPTFGGFIKFLESKSGIKSAEGGRKP